MSQRVPIYAAEIQDGLKEVLQGRQTVSYASLAVPFAPTSELKVGKRAWGGLERVRATNQDQPDLYYLHTILVSTVWNKNDDVFLPCHTWAARHTPEDKRFNYEHVDEDIIGHITENYVVDEHNKVIADDTSTDELPDLFHIVTPCVLYRYWQDETLQERMEKIIAGIAENKWFVSMEAAFSNFSYQIRRTDGTSKILPRNGATAFLTKHLRAYGGDGTYKEYQVGRVLENIIFTGKGLVRNPANEASVIFNTKEKNTVAHSHLEYLSACVNQEQSMTEKDKTESIEGLKSQLVASEQKLAVASEKISTLEAKLAEQVQANEALQKAIADERAEAQKAVRLTKLTKVLDLEETKAAEMNSRLAGLSDEDFAAHVAFLADERKAIKAISKAGVEGPKIKKPDPEKDSKGKATAGSVDLDKMDKDPADVALTVTTSPDKFEKARADIVKFLNSRNGIEVAK